MELVLPLDETLFVKWRTKSLNIFNILNKKDEVFIPTEADL